MILQKIKYKNKILAVTALILAVVLFLKHSETVAFIVKFIENNIASSDKITPQKIFTIGIFVYFVASFFTIISLLAFLNITKRIYFYILRTIPTLIDIEKIKKFFLREDLCNKEKLSVYLFTIATIMGFLLHLKLIIFGETNMEGISETISSFTLLFSGIVLLFSSTQIKRNPYASLHKKKLIGILVLLAVMIIYVFGEEVSWGQRVFGWESFGAFKELNVQSEINSHNFLNPLFRFIYPMVGMTLFTVLFLVWVFPTSGRSYLFQLVVPPPSLFFLVFIMAGASFFGQSEVFEELTYTMAALYSIRFFMCLRYPKLAT